MSTRSLHAPDEQPVTFVELFFDLVFVFAVTQITASTAHDLTWPGAARSVLLFWLIWWAWTQFTWSLNPADTLHRAVRAITLTATLVAFVMAASVPRAFADDALWFAIPYVVVRALGLWLQVAVDRERGVDDERLILRWAAGSTVGLVLVVVGALVDPPARNWIWLLVIAADLAAATAAGRGKTWDLTPGHVSERHGLFVIIALGESLILAGSAVAQNDRTASLVLVALAATTMMALLWWTYFDWYKEALEHGLASAPPSHIGRLTRDAFSLAHFVLVTGIVFIAAAVEEIVLHPDEPAPRKVLVSLGGGLVLLLGATVLAFWRTHRVLLARRLGVTLATAAVVVSLPETEPAVALAVAAAGVLVLVVVEGDPSASIHATAHTDVHGDAAPAGSAGE
ncbi:MAG: low temperature requirement protein A [Ilumatobacteraceae bacterium]|nr:low temperature requirement protein A [Acidimicrobiales bacterium]